LVERIVPLVLPSGGWDDFPELHPFQRVDYPRRPEAAFFDRLAAEMASIPRRRGRKSEEFCSMSMKGGTYGKKALLSPLV
jgi:hypothetical protein